MDRYLVELDGQQYEIEGDRPPTEAEARAAIGASTPTAQAQAPQPEGKSLGGLLSNVGTDLVNQVSGLANTVLHPIDTLRQMGAAKDAENKQALADFSGDPRNNAQGVFQRRYPGESMPAPRKGQPPMEALSSLGDTLYREPVTALSTVLSMGAPTMGAAGARRINGLAPRVGDALERGAQARVVDTMVPKVGANKVRFGNMAEKVAPTILNDLARDGAPWSRSGLQEQVGQRLAGAEAGLDAAENTRLAGRTFDTQAILDALGEKRQALTAEAVQATGMNKQPLGRDVTPAPFRPRASMIDQATQEVQQLGPVARYEPIRRIREAYDGPANAVYNPAVTPDFLTAKGNALGAADVTGALRETLAGWDPETAAANVPYSTYRKANDVLKATAENERVRPKVGRQIMAKFTGTVAGGQAAGPMGAAAGYVLGPLAESAVSSGLTTKLKTAALMKRIADATRSGNVLDAQNAGAQLQALMVALGAAGDQPEAQK